MKPIHNTRSECINSTIQGFHVYKSVRRQIEVYGAIHSLGAVDVYNCCGWYIVQQKRRLSL